MNARSGGRWLLIGVSVVVLAALAAGFSLIDSPWAARQIRLDERRMRDLRMIANVVDGYWVRHQRLPDSLATIAAEAPQDTTLSDPQTGQPYEYRPEVDDKFVLCAIFDRASPQGVDDQTAGLQMPRRWQHAAGRECFNLEVRRPRQTR